LRRPRPALPEGGNPRRGRGSGVRFLAFFFVVQQRRRSPAGARPGQRNAKHGKSVQQGLTGLRSNGLNHQCSRKLWKALPPTGFQLSEAPTPRSFSGSPTTTHAPSATAAGQEAGRARKRVLSQPVCPGFAIREFFDPDAWQPKFLGVVLQKKRARWFFK